MQTFEYDVIFVGAGPGGYVGAIRAAQLGFKTAVVEKGPTLGGTCLNVGCIPSKALLESSELYTQSKKDFLSHGIECDSIKLNLSQMQARKSKIVKDLTEGIRFLFKKNKIETHHGLGEVKSSHEVLVKTETNGVIELKAKKAIVLATGSVPNVLPGFQIDEKNIVTSTGALAFEAVPNHLVVVGGGVIGLELGSVWARLGARVTVLEYANQICPFLDSEIAKHFRRSLEKQGLKFITSAKVIGASNGGSLGQILKYQDLKSNAEHTLECDKILISTGRKPFSEGLGLEALGVKKDSRGFVQVDAHYQTSVPGVYAVGDLIPGPMLAHKAEEEGVALAEILAGQAGHVNYDLCPSVIYTFPEVAWVGATEEQLKQKGIDYNVGTFPFMANGRAKALGAIEGIVKIIADKKTDKILGGHIVGPRASELLGEIVVAMEFGGSSEDLARSFHAHPTLNEVVREAALGVEKRTRQM
jgi:dihydrolipoamide dehydrogenase